MRIGRIGSFGGLAAIVVVVSCLAVWMHGAEDLEFVELASPAGFRALVLQGGSSGFDPLLGSLQEVSAPGSATMVDLCTALLRDAGSPELGGPEASITIVEFFDYRCPYCKILTEILSQLHADRGIRVVYKDWPILGKNSRMAARAALAAVKQDKYHEFHSRLMSAGFVPTLAYIEDLGARLDLDLTRLRRDMQAPETISVLQRTAVLASHLGLVGTPALVVGRTIVQGAITREQLESLIDNEMSSSRPLTC